MDSDQGKLFIGGISWETDEEKLKDHFQKFGEVLQTVVMRDKLSGKPRGFGFVVFSDPNVLDSVLQETHTIDGRTVDAKRAISKEEQQVSKNGNPNSGRSSGGGGSSNKTKKIFVGGLPPTLSEDGFRGYFEAYGNVTDVVIMYDQQTNRPRGFGFISFDSEDAVDRVLHKTFHDLSGKQVEVKRALPKDLNSSSGSGGGRSMGSGGGGGGGNYQGYGGHGNGSNPYDSRMDSKYMQQQSTVSGYHPYASSTGYSAGYGYGSSNSAMGYNSYGSYGGAASGYAGPAASAYGNQTVPGGGYGGVPTDGQRNSWNSQGPAYGTMGYGSANWGANAGVGGGGPAGHSPAEAAGYGNQGYAYGVYGGNDGAYGNQASYGAVGRSAGGPPSSNSPAGGAGELQTGGYGAYGDASGNSGYPSGNYGSHGNQAGYGGGYGGVQARQTQQQ